MVAERLGRLAARLVTKAEPAAAKVRATEFAQRLKAEYERGLAEEQQPAASATSPDAAASTNEATPDDDVSAVAAALRSVDWASVRAVSAEKAAETKERMRAMAGDVDWSKVQAGAAVVSSALIAAVASGQIPIGGRLAGPIARAILNDSDLASRVSNSMGGDEQPPDLTADVTR
ncbi:MAG: hypothetical protein ACO3C1_02615 [Ilumatobacteraceae bacterium]